MGLTIQTQRLLDLYHLNGIIKSDDDESVNKFIDLIVQEKVNEQILKAKKQL